MEEIKIEWGAYSPAEKLIAIDAYLDGMAKLDDADEALNNERLEWLRAHLPAYDPKGGKNYIFISYSHLDYKSVYRDLAYFSYNYQRRVRFWYDEGLPVGKDWEAAAGKFMADKHCVGVIFYLSKNLLLSPSVFKEIQAVKKYNKPYFAVALNGGEYSAAKIFDNALGKELRTVQERQGEFEEFFPDNHTAVTYYEDTAFARINKISQFFDVTEEVFADFECEECDGGLRLLNYFGDKSDIRIPEKIDGKPVVEIGENFFTCKATTVFIPKTVEIIDFFAVFSANKCFDFEEFIVDKENPVYCDINGVLCTKSGTLVRAPKRWSWEKQFASIKEHTKSFIYAVSFSQKFEIEEAGEKPLISYEQFCAIMSFYFGNFAHKDNLMEKVHSVWTEKNEFYKCCLSLREKSLFNGIKYIDDNAFYGCTNINYMFLPNTVEGIGFNAFEKSNVNLICLSENIEIIQDSGFAFCSQLSTILTDWDNFEECGNKNNIRDAILRGKITRIQSSAFENTFIENIVLGEGIEKIYDGAFSNSYLIRTLNFLAPTLYNMGYKTFDTCENLRKVRFNGTKKEWYKVLDRSACLYYIFLKTATESTKYYSKYSDTEIYENPKKILAELGCGAGEENVPPEFKRATVVCTDGIIPPAEED